MANFFDQFDQPAGGAQGYAVPPGQKINPMAVGGVGAPAKPNYFDQFDTGEDPHHPLLDLGDFGVGEAATSGALEGVLGVGPKLKDWTDQIGDYLSSAISGKPYSQTQAVNDEIQKETERKHPTARALGELGGGVASYAALAAAAPELMGGGAASLPVRAGVGAASNAAIAGGDTAVRGGKPTDIARSAEFGLGLGGAAPIAGAAIGAIARPAVRGFSNWLGAPAVPGMSRSAANALADALATDNAVKNVPARLQSLGPEAMILDAGPATQGQAIGLSRDIGEPRTKIINALTNREKGADARLQSGMTQSFGPIAEPQGVADLLKAQRGAVHDEIPAALAAAPPVDVSKPLATIGAGLVDARGAEAEALKKARALLLDVTKSGPKPISRAAQVQSAKLNLADLIERGDPTIGVQPGMLATTQGIFKRLTKEIDDVLRTQVPKYAGIMDRSSALAKQIDQIEAGQGVLDSGKGAVRPDTLATEWPGLTPEEQAAKQVGTRSEIDRALGQNRNDRAAVAKVLGGEGDWNRQKLATMYGQQPTEDAIGLANAEADFQQAHRDIVRPAQTAAGLRAAKAMNPELDNPSGAHSGLLAATLGGPKEALTYGLLRGAQKAWKGLRANALEKRNQDLAEALIASDPSLVSALMQRGSYRAIAGKPMVNALAGAARTGIGYEGAVRKGKELPSSDELKKALIAIPFLGATAASVL